MDLSNQMPIATKSSKFDISKESLTANLAKKFSKIFKKGDIIFLYGEIGTGEECFQQAKLALQQWRHFDLGWINIQAPPPVVDLVVPVVVKVFGIKPIVAAMFTLMQFLVEIMLVTTFAG